MEVLDTIAKAVVILFSLVLWAAIAYSPVWLVFMVITIKRQRQQQATLVLSFLEQAIRMNLPLTSMVGAAGDSERGYAKRRLNALRDQLECGITVDKAITTTMPEIPDDQCKLLHSAEKLGQLSSQLHYIIEQRTEKMKYQSSERSMLMVPYMLFLPLFLMFMAGMVYVFIIPKFQEIFEDFDIILPWVTRVTMDMSLIVGPPMLLGAMASAAFILLNSAITIFVPFHRMGRHHRKFFIHLGWYLPFFRSLLYHRGLGVICRVLGQAVQAGWAMDQAVDQVVTLPMTEGLQKKMVKWAAGLRNGLTIDEAARKARLPKFMVGMLATSNRSGSLGEAFVFLSKYYSTRFDRVITFIREAALPIVTLVLAVFIGWIVLSLFYPLVVLIEQATQLTGMY